MAPLRHPKRPPKPGRRSRTFEKTSVAQNHMRKNMDASSWTWHNLTAFMGPWKPQPLQVAAIAIFIVIGMVSESCHSGFNIRMVQRHIYCVYIYIWVCLRLKIRENTYIPKHTGQSYFRYETGHISGLHIPFQTPQMAYSWVVQSRCITVNKK